MESMETNETCDDANRLLGDYRLKAKISEDGQKITWLAEQISVGREVIVDELVDHSEAGHRIFLDDTRSRAAVDHPLIASVYEAVDVEGCCLRASERLSGKTLQSMLDDGVSIEPVRFAKILRTIAEVNVYHETHGRATQPVGLGHVHVDQSGVTRMANLAMSGTRGADVSVRDVIRVGRELIPLIADGQPGTTRMQTVLAWMRGKERPEPLTWQEVIGLCNEIDRQLSAPSAPVLAESKRMRPMLERRGLVFLSTFTVAALLLIAGIAWLVRPTATPAVNRSHLPPVMIPAGDYPSPDGGVATLPAFWIDPHETTIRQYLEFLETLEVLAEEGREGAFDHPDQPEEKTDHKPDGWASLLTAAREREMWNGMPVSLDSPVAGVDFWDAFAYAKWRKARLPTQEEWVAAVHHQTERPDEIPVSSWRPFVEEHCEDRTVAGVAGVAGSLCEWTQSLAISPSNPLGRVQHVIVGGSYLQPSRNALSREWTADPSLRRPDLGFRLIRSAPGGS